MMNWPERSLSTTEGGVSRDSYWLMVSFRWGSFLGSPNFHLPSGKHTKKLLQMAVYS